MPQMPPFEAPLSILHTEASLGWGGQEIRILTEAAGMAARGHRVLLAAPAEARISLEAPRFGVPALALPIGKKRLFGLFALRDLLTRQHFDVVNSHSSTDTWLAAACRFSITPPPLVRTRHISAPIPDNFASRWLYTRATRHIVTTGESLRAQVMRETGAAASQVTSVPTGIDLAHYRPGDQGSARVTLGLADTFTIGIVATLRSWKGHAYLIDALADLGGEAALLIVGDGPQRAALEARAVARGLAGRVRFAGNQPDVVPWLNACDVFALPSYANEGVPQALMQAMAVGLPVVSTRVGAIAEIVHDDATGLLVPPQDAHALAAALRRLRDAPELRARLGSRARQLAAERFGLERMLDAMERVFCSVRTPG
jgi:glycosyltransferase involved in cell wall biosynthesis